MADETVRVVFKADTSGLTTGLSSLKTSIGSLSGAFRSLASGDITGFATSMAAIAGPAGIAAGAIAGVGAVAYKAAENFYETAIAVGRFGDAIGVTTEEASVLYELADDLKVPIGSFEMAAKKLAGEGLPLTTAALADLAIEYQAIQDPAARVAMLTGMFGRSGQDLAPILEMNTELLRAYHTELGAGQMITEQEYQQSIQLMGNLNQLKDVWQNLTMQIGGMIAIPVTEWLTGAVTGLDKLQLVMSGQLSYWTALTEYATTKFKPALDMVSAALRKIGDAVKYWEDRIKSLKASMPKWLIPGSPTPFELGLRGISNAMRDVGPMGVPAGGNTGAVAGADTAEMKGIRDDISWMVRQLPLTIRDAVVMGK